MISCNPVLRPGKDFTSVQSELMGYIRYINILTWIRGFWVKITNFLSFFCLTIPKRDLDTKKKPPDIEVFSESLVTMSDY